MNKKQERIRLLGRQIERLRRRIENLDRRSNRYSWTRVIVFFGGLALSVGAFFIVWWLGVVLGIITLTAFAILAYYHGKIDRSLARHTFWLHIKSTHVARMRLDWERIPSSTTALQADHPFEFDLDITGKHSVHQLLNLAFSRDGSQRLADWLLTTTPDLSTIQKRQTLVRDLLPLTLFRDKLVLNSLIAARKTEREQVDGQRLLRWLDQHAASPALRPLLWGSAVLNICTVVLFVLTLFVNIPQLWIFSLICAVILLFTTGDIRGGIFEDASYLRYAFGTLGSIFTYLEKYPYGKQHNLKKLCAPFLQDHRHSPSRLLKQLEQVAQAATLKNNGLLWLLVNALMPWDAYYAYRLSRYKDRLAKLLPSWLDTWFELEAINSLATFAYLNPEYVLPDVTSEQKDQAQATASQRVLFRGDDLGHPLLPVERKVTNSFTMDEMGEVVIITGSNMAGKSTFLRTLGVNLCLAYAGAPVNASSLHTKLFRLFTCIRVSDSVTDGYSYFYAEVKRLRKLLDALEESDRSGHLPLFFLIDEIFKGTNNRERLSGSRAYVRALVGHNCIGAISTHDLELVKLADELSQVQNYHFREEVINGEMVFDYVMRPGPSPTTNALKIMQMEGLPVEADE